MSGAGFQIGDRMGDQCGLPPIAQRLAVSGTIFGALRGEIP